MNGFVGTICAALIPFLAFTFPSFSIESIEAPFATQYQSTAKAISSLDLLIAEMQERTRMLGAFHEYQLVVSRADKNRAVVSH